MKVLNIPVINVNSRLNLEVAYMHIINPNMEWDQVSNILVINVTIKQLREIIY